MKYYMYVGNYCQFSGILIVEENVLSNRMHKLSCLKTRCPDNFSVFSYGCVSTHMHQQIMQNKKIKMLVIVGFGW